MNNTFDRLPGMPLFAAVFVAVSALQTLAIPPPPDPPTNPCPPTAPAGSRISLMEGALQDEYPIVSLVTSEGGDPGDRPRITLDLALAYSSTHAATEAATAANTCLGFGWTHSYNVFLYTYQSTLFRRDQTGRITKFLRVPSTSPVRYRPTVGYFETLVRNADGTFTINYPDGSLQTFKTFAGCPYLFATPIYQMTEQRDRNGNTTTLTYDGAGRLQKITDAVGRQITFTYDAWNRIQTITDPLGRATRLVHAMLGAQLVRIMDPDGKTVNYQYDSLFRITKKVKKSGATFLYTYKTGTIKAEYLNPNGTRVLLASVANRNNWQRNAAALTSSFAADYVPSTITHTDGRGNAWVYAYDKNAYPVTNSAPGQPTPGWMSYDPATLRRTTSVDANGHATMYGYDSRGNVISVTDCAEQVTRYTYDPIFNQVTSITDPNGFVTAYLYDAKGNRLKEIDPVGFTREWTYDPSGHLLSEKDRNGNITGHFYDGWGNRVQTVDPLGHTTTYAYDIIGNLTQLTDANGHTSTYTYDNLDRRLSETDPLGNTTSYAYDAEGHLSRVSDANGHITSYAYDERGRLIHTTNALGSVDSITYDLAGNRTTETDPNGHTTRYVYDSQNRLAYVSNALGYVTTFTYDPVGNTLAEKDANSHASTFAYDCLDRLIAVSNALGYVTRYEYDTGPGGGCGCGSESKGTSLISKKTDANGRVIYYKYCPLGRLLGEIRKQGDTADIVDEDDAVTSYTCDPNGNRLSTAVRLTATESLTNWVFYDALNHPIAEINAAGDESLRTYDPVGNVYTVAAFNGNVTTNAYDAKNRLIQVTDGLGRAAGFTYDAVGNRLSLTDGNDNTVMHAYDWLNRLVATTDARGNTSSNVYDAAGNLLATADNNGNWTTYAYDALNRRTGTTDALGGVVRSAYDAVGNRIALTDANNHGTVFSYDGANRLIEKVYSNAPSDRLRYTYDGVGNLLTRTDQKGVITTYRYSELYSLTNRHYSSGTDDRYTYDLSGRTLTAERDSWLDTFAYDGANRVIQTTQNGQPVDYVYDIRGRTRTLVYPGGRVVVEAMDLRQRLTVIDDGATPTPLVQYAYDQGGRVTTRIFRNGVIAVYDYNADNGLTAVRHVVPPSPGVMGILIAGFEYAYDPEGHRTHANRLRWPAESEQYGYDVTCQLVDYKTGELTGPTIPAPVIHKTWDIDPAGNWNRTTRNGVPEDRTHNAANQLVAIGGASLTYDATGNLAENADYRYAWDEENRLSTVTRKSDNQVVGQYAYDALSRRVVKVANPSGTPVETRFFYDDWRVVEEQDGAGVLQASFVYGPSLKEVLTMDRGGQTFYYHHDALRSPEAVTDSTATPVERYTYDAYGAVAVADGWGAPVARNPWGTPHSAIGNPTLFMGHGMDEETALYGFDLRSYSPALGRFLSRNLTDLDSPNLYVYFGNNPLAITSVDGLLPDSLPDERATATVNGATSCGLSKPVDDPMVISINNTKCTKSCTQDHENQHASDLGPCCKKARAAYQKTGASKPDVMKKWNDYLSRADSWTECNAYGRSVTCAEALWKSKKCDCPPPENKKCCEDIKNYKSNSESKQKSYCGTKGSGSGPECPF
jgi:RHS repeat-associated protein